MICVTSYLKFMVSPGEAIGQTQKIIRSEKTNGPNKTGKSIRRKRKYTIVKTAWL